MNPLLDSGMPVPPSDPRDHLIATLNRTIDVLSRALERAEKANSALRDQLYSVAMEARGPVAGDGVGEGMDPVEVKRRLRLELEAAMSEDSDLHGGLSRP